jgi:long-subunit acyl-CoA synthetase (AMP-forming)
MAVQGRTADPAGCPLDDALAPLPVIRGTVIEPLESALTDIHGLASGSSADPAPTLHGCNHIGQDIDLARGYGLTQDLGVISLGPQGAHRIDPVGQG